MALFMKQDFTPPILSRRWIAIKFRPNMLIYSREHIISILESGLMFREDSIEVEQEAPSLEEVWGAAGGGKGGWFTRGESLIGIAAVGACVYAFPPRSLTKKTLCHLAAYISIPIFVRAHHRWWCRGTLRSLLMNMRDYLALSRRAAACLRECAALHKQLDSMSSAVESTRTLLCRQQSELSVLMSRASSALLGNAPWLRSDVAWDAVTWDNADNLMKIHHAFLVVQSTLLKHIAMAHYIPSVRAQKMYKNHNERIYWIHNTLIEHLNTEFKENYEALDRMYRLLKNYDNKDTNVAKKLGSAINNRWSYSEVHTGIAKTCLELKMATNKCNSLDMFLDSAAVNNQNLDLDTLNKDVDDLIDYITNSLNTIQHSQLRLKKLQGKFGGDTKAIEKDNVVENSDDILKIEDVEPEIKDEVFYFIKTDDNESVQPPEDVTTGPGKKERDATKVVLHELKRKLGRREDAMRERERQALVKTMPELKDVPEFPRQIKMEEAFDRKGFITKLKKPLLKKKMFENHYKITKNRRKNQKYLFNTIKYKEEADITIPVYEANANLNCKSKLITISNGRNKLILTKWSKYIPQIEKYSSVSDLSDLEVAANKAVHEAVNAYKNDAKNLKVTKKDLELTNSSSESDFEGYKERQIALLKDIRKHRAIRRKNYPKTRSIDNVDESLRPIEYSFGTGMAMASVLQVNSAKLSNMAAEEVFIGDGEVSNDSGNDEDA